MSADDPAMAELARTRAELKTALLKGGVKGTVAEERADNLVDYHQMALKQVLAHRLAEQIREDTRASLTQVTASNGADWGRTWAHGRERAADLIDPEAQQ